MSADRWSTCFHCCRTAKNGVAAVHEDYKRQLGEAYGQIPLDEYRLLEAEAQAAVMAAQDKLSEIRDNTTFREDWDITGADEGTVCISYAGSCSVCGARVTFNAEQAIDSPTEAR
jgi:hypothetical protein